MEELIKSHEMWCIIITMAIGLLTFIIATVCICVTTKKNIWTGKTYKTFEFSAEAVLLALVVALIVGGISFVFVNASSLSRVNRAIAEELQAKYSANVKSVGTKQWAINRMPDEPTWLRYGTAFDTYLERYIVIEDNEVIIYKANPDNPGEYIKEAPKVERKGD